MYQFQDWVRHLVRERYKYCGRLLSILQGDLVERLQPRNVDCGERFQVLVAVESHSTCLILNNIISVSFVLPSKTPVLFVTSFVFLLKDCCEQLCLNCLRRRSHVPKYLIMSTSTRPKTAYITGGASGIGRVLATRLLSKGWHVFIADRDAVSAESFAAEYNGSPASTNATIHHTYCDTASWDSQLSSFRKAMHVLGGRIDFVAPIAGIGEKKWLPFPSEMATAPATTFFKPNLSVVNVDLTGVLYTIALAVQHFRRQDPIEWSPEHGDSLCRGKIGLVASICGIYCVPSLPIYTAAKHALVGLTRSYGALLREEGITVNAVAPNVVRTGISSDVFYQALEAEGLLTPMEGLMRAFDEIIEKAGSGEVYECGPRNSWTKRPGAEYLDQESERCCEMLQARAKALHHDTA